MNSSPDKTTFDLKSEKESIQNIRTFTIGFVSGVDCTPLIKNKDNEPVHEISNNVVCAASKASDQPAHMRSLIRAFVSRLSIL